MSGPLRPWLFLAARSAPPKPFAASTARIPNRRLSFTNERYPITLIFQRPATQGWRDYYINLLKNFSTMR
jgi:hypothetical protein